MGEENLEDLIAEAQGAWTSMRADPDYVEPAPYIPRERPKPPPEGAHRGPPTEAVAARWEAAARDFALRCPRPAEMREIVDVWEQYAHRWTKPPAHLPLPIEEIFPLGLARLQLHAVFQAAQRHCDRKERLGKTNQFPPYELIVLIARKEAKRRKEHAWHLSQIKYLRARGELKQDAGVGPQEVELDEDDDDLDP